MTKILVVDDEPQIERLIKQRMRQKIRSQEYDFVFALDGYGALDLLRDESDIDIILSDINMPKMDGLSLLKTTRIEFPKVKTVIVSAYGDMSNIRTAMNLGAFDFITKPIDFADLEATIQKTIDEILVIKKLELMEEENRNLVEIDRLRTQFFTDISHEIRTPLTVIVGMAQQIQENPDKWLHHGLSMIDSNSQHLLTMVNQILEIRKIQTDNVELYMESIDIVGFTRTIVDAFAGLLDLKDLQLTVKLPESDIEVSMDLDKYQTIVSNLLSNAIKYTPTGGQVTLCLTSSTESIDLTIKDSGIGIPTDQIDKVFERFYRVETSNQMTSLGTGIGLSLVKEYTTLLGGTIGVESKLNNGSTFHLSLPIQKMSETMFVSKDRISDARVIPKYHAISPMSTSTYSLDELNKVLIIEDNEDVLQYLKYCMEGLFEVDCATDGEYGIERAIEIVPDIVISDVMMPIKDGFEVCETLKQDSRTSHIPIILLTAKVDQDSKMQGLSSGADVYLQKPFDKKELLVRIEKLIESRESLQARFSKLDTSTAEEQPTREEQFVIDLKGIVNDHLQDEHFGILELCKAMGMSRTQLHRKIKALSGVSTSIFVRLIRLRRAEELLRCSSLNISEIAYEVGFNDPKYFSSLFSGEYGSSPKHYRNTL